MFKKKNPQNKKVLVGSLAGGLLAAATALLLAQKSGGEWQEHIGDMLEDLKEKIPGQKKQSNANNLLIYGSIASGLLAALSGLYFTPQTRRYIRGKVANQYRKMESMMDVRKSQARRITGGLKRSSSRKRKTTASRRKY